MVKAHILKADDSDGITSEQFVQDFQPRADDYSLTRGQKALPSSIMEAGRSATTLPEASGSSTLPSLYQLSNNVLLIWQVEFDGQNVFFSTYHSIALELCATIDAKCSLGCCLSCLDAQLDPKCAELRPNFFSNSHL